MSEYDELYAAVQKVDTLTDEQKEAILAPAKALNTSNGSRGSDLINVKKQLETATKSTQTYKEFADSMAKYNLQAADLEKLAKNAGIEKTNQDELDAVTKILKETQAANKSAAEELRVLKQEKTLGPRFEQAVAEFKDSEGKAIVLKPFFLDGIKEELYKGIKDGENEIIIQDSMNKALLQAHVNQNNFLENNGFADTNKPFHKVDEGSVTRSGSVSGIDDEAIHKIVVDGGQTEDSVARAMSAARAQKAQQTRQ